MRAIDAIAAKQFGLITRAQAKAVGFTQKMVSARVTKGTWCREYPGVYRLVSSPVSWEQKLMAAQLWAGDDTLFSHRTAAWLFSLPGGETSRIDITTTRKMRYNGTLIRFHQVGQIQASDIVQVRGFRTTEVTRTLIDLGDLVTDATIEDALDNALRRNLTSLPKLRWRLSSQDMCKRRGTSHLTRLVVVGDVTESRLERRFLALLRTSSLPMPQRQVEVRLRNNRRAFIDFAYPEVKLAIECDGRATHFDRSDWENDLERRTQLARLGWRVIHVTWQGLSSRPQEIIRSIEDALEQDRVG
ncbi:MAG: type IV toxin-antitoxin system AbiEi family antitoxin domain-containing protein [Actinomycetota bacterium]